MCACMCVCVCVAEAADGGRWTADIVWLTMVTLGPTLEDRPSTAVGVYGLLLVTICMMPVVVVVRSVVDH